jgi:polyhydroxybutyrate depolymerase
MRHAINRVGLCLVLVSAAACSPASEPVNPPGSGGASGGGTGGSVGSGGSGSGGANASGGVSGGTGGAAMTTDASTDSPSSVDAPVADGSAGDRVDNHTPMPSAGCGKANPAKGARTIMTGGMTGNYNVNLPANYDPNKPWPLGFGFHGFGNGACGPTGGECQGFAALPAITVYPKSLQAGWEGQPQPLTENLQFYHDVLAVMKSEYCVDLNRIFIAGVSSGGQFIEQIACRDGESLWQVSAVSAYVDKGADTGCKGTPPVLITQGVTETTVSVATAVMFAKRNGCSATMPAGLAQARTDMMAAFNMKKADFRCVDWDACTLNPVRYCISSQVTYSGLTHGWPRVGGMLIADFQSMLK